MLPLSPKKMKKFKILNHTADIRAVVYGTSLESLFKNAAELLYCLMEIKWSPTEEKKDVNIQISADTLEDLMVKFLNELIYYAEVKRLAGRLLAKNLSVEENNCRIVCKMEGRKIEVLRKEIKAATYHGLKIEEANGVLSVSVIFDV